MFAIFERSLTQPAEVCAFMKPQFLEWLCLNDGIVAVRKMYKKLTKVEPYCLEMHKKMIELESISLTTSRRWILYAHTMSCRQFGSRDVGE